MSKDFAEIAHDVMTGVQECGPLGTCAWTVRRFREPQRRTMLQSLVVVAVAAYGGVELYFLCQINAFERVN